MNFLKCMPVSISTRCSSSEVPSVAATRACVSPRVKRAEPWTRGRTPTSETMKRMSAGPRPPMRFPSSVIILRMYSYFTSS